MDEKIENPRPMQCKLYIQNKIVDISTLFLNNLLSVEYNGHPQINIDRFNPSNEELLIEIWGCQILALTLRCCIPSMNSRYSIEFWIKWYVKIFYPLVIWPKNDLIMQRCYVVGIKVWHLMLVQSFEMKSSPRPLTQVLGLEYPIDSL